MKKVILVLLMTLFIFPDSSYAFGVVKQSDPGAVWSKGPYIDRAKDAVIVDWRGSKVKQHDIAFFHDADYTSAGTKKTQTASAGKSYTGFGFTCVGWYKFKAMDESGNTLYSLEIRVDDGDLVSPVCNSGGDDENAVPDGENCDPCGIFNCPEWATYMGKLEEIKNAIPPPPNWGNVSEIFSDAIVPPLISGTKDMLTDLLGKAPTPPPTLPDLPPLKDDGFKNEKPKMEELPDIPDVNKDDIKNGGPVIPVEEDPTGGFNLIVDPVGSLPDVVPGGDPGAYKRDPKELPAKYPGAPKDTEIDMGGAPKPNDPAPKPPKPGDDGATPPKPGGGVEFPGKPNDVNIPGKDHYMPQPKGGT